MKSAAHCLGKAFVMCVCGGCRLERALTVKGHTITIDQSERHIERQQRLMWWQRRPVYHRSSSCHQDKTHYKYTNMYSVCVRVYIVHWQLEINGWLEMFADKISQCSQYARLVCLAHYRKCPIANLFRTQTNDTKNSFVSLEQIVGVLVFVYYTGYNRHSK